MVGNRRAKFSALPDDGVRSESAASSDEIDMARLRNRRGRGRRWRLPAQRRTRIERLAKTGVEIAAQRHGIQLLANPIDLFDQRGTDVQNTRKAYEKHWKGLSRFLSIIGDYESMLALDPHVGNDANCHWTENKFIRNTKLRLLPMYPDMIH
ncbi:Tyr recombinase domain-containing protein [Plasmodiophora brassicae]